MNPVLPSVPRRGIRAKIALFSWSITILTLLIFVLAIIPEQKRIFQENLASKARGIAVSLQDIAAGAVVNEDYSSVVDHCRLLLVGDPALAFLVMTRKDGFSLINERSGWRADTLDETWRPNVRATTSGIDTVSLSGQRVFQYSRPFDYSGLEWGWIHVGLSLENYDRSVSGVYWRTCLLAVACIAISLLASLGYARQFVRPIQSLEAAVRKVAEGDLSARTVISSGDEVESLAQSFNRMTDALRRRDKILESVRFAARELLSKDDWKLAIHEVLNQLGQAAETSRAYIFENHLNAAGAPVWSHRYEWVAPGVLPQIDDPALQNLPWRACGMEDWAQTLAERRIVVAHTRELNAPKLNLLGPTIQSLILIPVVVQDQWWGFLGFDQCDREREWSGAEKDSFRAAADMLGAAIERQRTRDALLEAKETLEERVEARTRELREQVAAKEQALGQLAETQNMLMDVSRKSGMAEIATGVLHNVGNVLNSVNVSANLVTEHLRQSRLGGVAKLATLLREHEPDLASFLTSDPRGKQVPGYLQSLGSHLELEQTHLIDELRQLVANVEHIKQIVAMQQSYARVSGVVETLQVPAVVEDALRITESGMVRQGITVLREFQPAPAISVDKHKILQVMVNLLRNARQAVEADAKPDKTVEVRIVHIADEHRVRIRVRDNGLGIAPENLTRIFSHGFTTKKDGHGFGLHLSALAAREMGGSLLVESAGRGQGASFTLELPLNQNVGTNGQPTDERRMRQNASSV